jgi:nucleoside-diphosphate-sugar epimerase
LFQDSFVGRGKWFRGGLCESRTRRGEGTNIRAYRQDVARLYRLALKKGDSDGIYHAVGEEGVPMRQVIEVIGRALNVPVVSIRKEEADDYSGPLSMFAGLDMPASSALTQQRLGWTPTGMA